MKRILSLLVLSLISGYVQGGICDTARVYFISADASLGSREKQKIDELIREGKFTPKDKISITGFADHAGQDTANLSLSKKRAEAVTAYMISKGWKPADIIVTQGIGELRGTAEEMAGNRRVEIVAYTRFTAHNLPKIIFFDAGTDTVRKDNLNKLDSLVSIMKAHPCMKISIEGHTCCTQHEKTIRRGDSIAAYNSNSISRAMQVEHYLLSKGIEKERLGFNAHGTGKPLYRKPKNEEEHKLNCRVEIKIKN